MSISRIRFHAWRTKKCGAEIIGIIPFNSSFSPVKSRWRYENRRPMKTGRDLLYLRLWSLHYHLSAPSHLRKSKQSPTRGLPQREARTLMRMLILHTLLSDLWSMPNEDQLRMKLIKVCGSSQGVFEPGTFQSLENWILSTTELLNLTPYWLICMKIIKFRSLRILNMKVSNGLLYLRFPLFQNICYPYTYCVICGDCSLVTWKNPAIIIRIHA